MPYTEEEKRIRKREANKKWREQNKEYNKKYREDNIERLRERNNVYMRKYSQTEKGKKSRRIKKWKKPPKSGGLPLICDDNDLMYEHYINTEFCDNPECKVKLTEDRYPTPTTRCLDHNHKTGEFRFVLCANCNKSSKYRQY